MTCCVSGNDVEGVLRRVGAFIVWAGVKGDRTRYGVDSEVLGVSAVIRVGQAVSNVLATVGGIVVKGLRGIDGGTGGGILGNAHRGAGVAVADVAGGEARGNLINVVDVQGHRAFAGVVGRISGNNGEVINGFAFEIRVAGQGDRPGDRINSQIRVAARFQREGNAIADIAGVGCRGGVDHLACAAVFVDCRGDCAAGDRRGDLIEVVDAQRDRTFAGVVGRIGGDNGEAVAGFAFEIRVAGQGDRAGFRVDRQARVAARFQ
ncbi:hypothetical protein D3C75_828280 [compost metagenome]